MHTLSAIALKDKFYRGELSAEEITLHFLQRIEKYDQHIGAFLNVFTHRALQRAHQLDKKRAAGQQLGRLAALPIAIKDNIHVKGEITSCASRFLANYTAPFDSTVVRLLEAEDAIIIGKTNLDEFAMGSTTENSAMHPTRNPWNLACIPGGSSGGSAAAVSARLCPLALGSDTGGSVRQPAAFCGVVGFKPTYGRVSRHGLVAFGSSLDQIGPIAANACDAALVMEVIGRHCEKDSTSIPEAPEEYLAKLQGGFNGMQDLRGMKIGIPFHFLEGLAEEPRRLFQNSLQIFKELGASLVEIDLSLFKYAVSAYYIIATAEASTNLARFDGIRYGKRSEKAKSLSEVYDFSREEGFGPEVKRRILLGTFVLSSGYQDAYYKKAQKVRSLLIAGYKAAFQKCDLIATPVSPSAAFELGSTKDPLQLYLEDIYTIPLNLGGVPGISVPAGFTCDGKPIGLQLIGPQKKDVLVLQGAYAYEQAFKTAIPDFMKKEMAAWHT